MRGRTPVILQLTAAECGAASLAMVLAHHGRQMSLDVLRGLCGVSRDGAKASSLLRAARALGLEAKGLKAEPHHLAELPMPMIAYVNFNHFLVVDGIDDKGVRIIDPAGGRRRETMAEFSESFTGVVLTFVPGADFVRADERPGLAEALKSRFDGVRGALLFAALTALALVVPGILLPVFSRIFVDYLLIRGLSDWLPALLIGLGLTALARFALIQLQSRALLAAEMRMSLETGAALMAKLLRLPVGFFDQRFAGEIADRVRLNEELSALLTGKLAQAAVNLIAAAFFLLVMLLYQPLLTLAVLVLALANAGVLLLSGRLLGDRYRKISIDTGTLMGARIAGLRDMETFKASGAEDMVFARWTGLAVAAANGRQAAARISALIQPVPGLISALITAVILIGGGWLVMDGALTLGELVGYQTLAASFVAPVVALAGFGAELQQVRSLTSRLEDVNEQPDDARFAQAAAHDGRVPGGRLSADGLRFGYAPLDPPLIDDFSIDIRPGMRVALVGASGSGKSTLGKLLAGLEQPGAGQVCLDGRPLLAWPREILASRLAYVRQEVTLFEGTVRENLTLWDARMPEPEVMRAARDAAVHEVIAGRPGGYDAVIAEGGRNFSGGERQRFEIARALASDPAVIVLDEATSALDPLSEEQVMTAIRQRGVTCVIVAHRLSTIRDCDLIMVMDRGRVVESGDHATLMARGGAYAGLLEA
ncbi:MAG: NHLP family bacteriocin export ABC transporter peptidase/permease/ATPase subunit [Polymorphobacter sp.]|uniref:NHLP family bacteriocin export ABC transporter peptidase/permease/ATPase subunit n=1 Tax=Polymorphobacter sp. TaxID=1909290 RepID=UPI003A84FFC9